MLRRVFSFLILGLLAAACSLVQSNPADVATAVAGTLTAGAPTALPPVAVVTFTPEPPLATAPPSATEAPSLPPPAYACPLAVADFNTVLCLDGPNQFEIANTSALGPVQSVAVSSDGGLVAYLAGPFDGTPELWVVNGDGSNARKLVSKEQLPPSQPDSVSWPRAIQWQAGTHNIFFDTGWTPNGGVGGPGEYVNFDLWRVNSDSGELTEILSAGSGGIFSLSPDGNWIAISQPDSIDLLSADGSTPHSNAVTFANIITYSEYTYKPEVTWSADGTFLTVPVPSADPMAANPSATVYRVGVDGAAQTLGTFAGNYVFGGTLQPSPDGQWVAYTTLSDPNNPQTYFYVAHTDGSLNNGGLVPNGTVVQGWSPDSIWVAYSAPNDGLYVSGFNGVGQPLAAGVQAVRDVVWSGPTSVVFSGSVNDHWGLRLAQVGGTFADLAGPFSNTMVFAVRP